MPQQTQQQAQPTRIRARTTAVELPPNDTVPVANDVIPGECNPPPPPPDPLPPIRNTAQTHQVNPIKIRSDEHDEEHDERALALVVTDAVELLNNPLYALD